MIEAASGEQEVKVSSPLNQLPASSCGSVPGSVPVFNCIVILRIDSSTGRAYGRVANLPGLHGEAASERDLLFQLTRRFKDLLRTSLAGQHELSWIDPPEAPGAGEQQRFIPIHL